VFVKHFARPDNDAPLETRIFVHGNDGWGGVTYKWQAGEAEAELVEDGLVEPLTVDGQTFDYLYPSRTQCWQCHQAGTGPVLGFRTRQLNRTMTYANGISANQVESFSAAGFISGNLKTGDLADVITSGDVDDPDLTDEAYVRSYLDSNCSHCHQPDGSSRAFFDARLITPLNNQSLICGPLIDGLGLPSPAVLKPGSLQNSVLFHRVTSEIPSVTMPPIARGPVDYQSVSRIANWLLAMNADSCTKSQSFFGGGDLGITGAPAGPVGSDPWRANMVIQKNATFTNTENNPITLLLDGSRSMRMSPVTLSRHSW
jgi:mono/diheme cytochrome c family protein